MNLLQIACLCEVARRQAGRASRSVEYADSDVWDFRHDESAGLSLHPALTRPLATLSHPMGEGRARGVLAEIFKEFGKQQRQASPDDCTEALRLELRNDRGTQALRIEEIERAEKAADYPEVAKLCRIITADTQTVLVDQALAERIESRDRTQFPSWRDIMQNSVQIWSSRLKSGDWPLKPIGPDEELWAWTGQNYNSFLGYMADVLPLLKAGKTGFDVL